MPSSDAPAGTEPANTEVVRRRLTAVLLADAAAYTKMMAADERSTVSAVARCRAVMADIVRRGGGRVINQVGDAFLAEAGSIVAAVQVAMTIQNTLRSPEMALRGMMFRIGVHLGDVLDHDGEIYGEGVNIAARLQAVAPPGAVAVSGAVYDAIRHRIDARFEPLGKVLFKNVDYPLDVYMWSAVKDEPKLAQAPDPQGGRFRPTTHPVIRVMPFRSFGEGEGRGQGGRSLAGQLAEELFTLLSSMPSFSVLRGRAKAEKADSSLYLLNANLRTDAETSRVTVHLQSAVTKATLWSGSYDLTADAGLRVQEQIARDIVTEIQVKLTEGEHARLWTLATANWRAWLMFQIGHHKEHLSTREGKLQARRHYLESLRLDPNYVPARVALGFCYVDAVRFGWEGDREGYISDAAAQCAEALRLDPDYPETHALCAYIAILGGGDKTKALTSIARAVSLAPDSAKMIGYMGGIQLYLGDVAAAAQSFERAMALTPHYAIWIATNLGMAYRLGGRLHDARIVFEQTHARSPDNPRAVIGLIGVYVRLGQLDQARALARELLRIDPFFTVDAWSRDIWVPDPVTRADLAADLRVAGLA